MEFRRGWDARIRDKWITTGMEKAKQALTGFSWLAYTDQPLGTAVFVDITACSGPDPADMDGPHVLLASIKEYGFAHALLHTMSAGSTESGVMKCCGNVKHSFE